MYHNVQGIGSKMYVEFTAVSVPVPVQRTACLCPTAEQTTSKGGKQCGGTGHGPKSARHVDAL